MNAPDLVNWIEVFFWPALGIGCLGRAVIKRGSDWFFWVLGPTFILFGVSDYIELQTGAWWRPWWLFVMKVGCVVVFVVGALRFKRRRRHRS